jgi:hypothetical protein
VLTDITGIEPPAPCKRTIDTEGRVIKDAVPKTLQERQKALTDLVDTVGEYRSLADQALTLRGSDCAEAVQTLNKAIDRLRTSFRLESCAGRSRPIGFVAVRVRWRRFGAARCS